MGFNSRIATANTTALTTFANCAVIALLHDVETVTFRAIFDDSVEVASAYQEDQVIFKPAMTALSTDIAAISGAQTFEILRDGETESKVYAFDGKPRPDGSGLTLVLLAVKR